MKFSTNKLFSLVLIIVISLILFLIYSSFVLAANFYEISHNCPEGCVKNKPIAYSINITNLGEDDIYLLYMRLRDNINLQTIAEFGMKDAVDTSDMTEIPHGMTHLFEFQGTLLAPNQGSNLTYQLCMIQRVPFEIWTTRGDNIEYCYKTNYTIPMLGCILDTDCDDEKYCLGTSCTLLNCTECQYIEEHQCIDYECCNNIDCALYEVCTENNCELLNCDSTTNQTNETMINASLKQYVINHICSPEPCADDEIIVDYVCVKADCKEDEILSDYECKKLDCPYDEGFFNHTCIKLDCKETEAIVNNKCVPLECADDEAVITDTCEKLDCRLFQKAESHKCLVNTTLLIEVIFLAIIVSLCILDIKRYSGKHRKKLVSMLLKKAKQREKETKSEK